MSDDISKALKTLGLSAGASTDEVRKRYRKVARTMHPDMGGSEKGFARVTSAYQLLLEKGTIPKTEMKIVSGMVYRQSSLFTFTSRRK